MVPVAEGAKPFHADAPKPVLSVPSLLGLKFQFLMSEKHADLVEVRRWR